MADEDVSLLNGAQDRQRDVEEAEEQVEEFDLRKLTLTDLWAALKELHRLKGGDTSTGSFSEALARGIVNFGERGYASKTGGGMLYAGALAMALTLMALSVGLDLYMTFLGFKYRGDTKCAVPLESFVLLMGLAGLALIPVGAVNKLTIDATPSEARAGYNGALAWLVFLIPLFQAFWFIVGSSWVYQINASGVDNTAQTQCEPDLYYFTYYYCLFIMIALAVLLWLVVMACVGMCLGTRFCLDLLPDGIRNVRQNVEAQKQARKGE